MDRHKFLGQKFLGPGENREWLIECSATFAAVAKQNKPGEPKLWCVGKILYQDMQEGRREMGFCRSYDHATNTWIREQNSDYEYSY